MTTMSRTTTLQLVPWVDGVHRDPDPQQTLHDAQPGERVALRQREHGDDALEAGPRPGRASVAHRGDALKKKSCGRE